MYWIVDYALLMSAVLSKARKSPERHHEKHEHLYALTSDISGGTNLRLSFDVGSSGIGASQMQ